MQTIILDFDGTIADTKNSIIQTVQETFKVLGLPPAIVVGFFDMVMMTGYSTNFDGQVWTPLIKIKKTTVITTSNGSGFMFEK